MATWETVSSLATAFGTLVLATATFSAVRSSNRSARIAEQALREQDGVIYLAMALRNLGAGIALLHGWYPWPTWQVGGESHAAPSRFRRLTIDLYVPPGDTGYWEGAVRDESDELRPELLKALAERAPITIDLLYSDQEGGQRMISRFSILPSSAGGWFCKGARHWNLDRPEPRLPGCATFTCRAP